MDAKRFEKPRIKAKTFNLYSVPYDILQLYRDLFPEMNINQELSALCTEYMQGKINARKAGKL